MKALELTRFDRDMDGSMTPDVCGRWVIADDAADELRRLAELNAELLGALKDAQNAMMDASGCSMPAARELSEVIHKVRATIAKAKEQQ